MRIAIIGASCAGLGLALKLKKRQDSNIHITVIEKHNQVGGATGSFEHNGIIFDYGSHRVHQSIRTDILNDIIETCGDILILRKRNGRIRLRSRYIKFPLNGIDLLTRLPFDFSFGIARDILTIPFRKKNASSDNMHDILLKGLGPTICNEFYFPYTKKLWGLDPDQLSSVQAKRRISANSIGKILGKVIPVGKSRTNKLKKRYFYYPTKGFGQICEGIYNNVVKNGVEIKLSRSVDTIERISNDKFKLILNKKDNELKKSQIIEADIVFSTIPIIQLIRSLSPEPPKRIIEANNKLQYMGMILCYLTLNIPRFTPYDAHYFPDRSVIFSRLSEPKNYSDTKSPSDITGICIEIPCMVGSYLWEIETVKLKNRILEDLNKVDLPISCEIVDIIIKRLPEAYPIYEIGFDNYLTEINNYLDQIPGIVSIGRQGLFTHNNIHHSLENSYAANECLSENGTWDQKLWNQYRREFESHVVED